MNIISHNCLGGFIYRDILKEEYKNPFIWTGMDTRFFPDFIDNFETINFNNVMIDKEGQGFNNNFKTVIDKKWRFRNGHIIFSEKDNIPRTDFDDKHITNVNVYYNKPWEYILEKYEKRIKRMDNDIRVALYDKDPNETIENLNRLSDICFKHKYPCIIFTDKNVKQNEYVKVFYIKYKEPWLYELYEKYNKELNDFVK